MTQSTSNTQEINTDNLTIQLVSKPDCLIELDIKVNPKATLAAQAKAVKAVSKEVSIPGFRKGKAPTALILTQFQKQVNQEWHDTLLNASFQEYIKSKPLYPYSEDNKSFKKVEIKSVDLEKGSHLFIQYETYPTIPTITPASLKLKKIDQESITADKIDQVIDEIQLYHATWHEIEDRGIQEGDFVHLTIDAVEAPHQTICEDTLFEVSKQKMGNWMYHLLLGHHLHDQVEGLSEWENSTPPADFKPTLCRIAIKKIKVPTRHPLNQELATKVGLTAIEELRTRVEADLERNAKEEQQQGMREQVIQLLKSNYKFDIPLSVYDKSLKAALKSKSADTSSSESALSDEERKNKIKEDIIAAYQFQFIIYSIAQLHHIEATQDEVIRELIRKASLASSQSKQPAFNPSEEEFIKIKDELRTKKVLDYLIQENNDS